MSDDDHALEVTEAPPAPPHDVVLAMALEASALLIANESALINRIVHSRGTMLMWNRAKGEYYERPTRGMRYQPKLMAQRTKNLREALSIYHETHQLVKNEALGGGEAMRARLGELTEATARAAQEMRQLASRIEEAEAKRVDGGRVPVPPLPPQM